jgi:tetratricopeptide (TPR) repeat protein
MEGNILQRRKDFVRAAGYFEKALESDPENAFALYGLGNCKRGLSQLEEAIALWQRVLRQEPHNQNLYTRVGDALLTLGDVDQSRFYYQKSLDLGFDQYALLGLANLHAYQKRYDEALKCCQRILQHDAGNQRVLKVLLKIYEGQGDTAKAEQVRARLP